MVIGRTVLNSNEKPIEQYDQSGKNTILEYDFKGNPGSIQNIGGIVNFFNFAEWKHKTS